MNSEMRHERLCPFLSIPYDEMVDAINSGQYHYSEREFLDRQRKSATAKFEAAEHRSENCEGVQVINEGDEVKLYCPVYDKSWTRQEIETLYREDTSGRPSLFLSLNLLDEAARASSEKH